MKNIDPSKGPWRLGESQGGQWFVYGIESTQPIRPRIKLAKRHTKLERANATVLATAWEMLDTLKMLDLRGGLGLDVHAHLRGLIAKATETPDIQAAGEPAMSEEETG